MMEDQHLVFYANMCSVCYITVKEANLKKCSCCKAVSYCSESHQRKHWKSHKKLCKVIQSVEKMLKPEKLDIQYNWYKYRTNFMMLCELAMKRKLNRSEVNTILFPNTCQICHTTINLKPCEECLCVNYCCDDHKLADFQHNEICNSLNLCVKLDLFLAKHTLYPEYNFCGQGVNSSSDIEQFIEAYIEVVEPKADALKLQQILVSDLLTCPLSLLHAVTLFNYNFKERTILHVVGAGVLETSSLKSWEVILKAYVYIKELTIYFIGPEVELEDSWHSEYSNLKMNFSTELYHDFVKCDEYEKPDLLCTFNCGFHEFQNSESDTWSDSLPLLVGNKNVPLIITSFTANEAEQDIERLVSINSDLKVKKCVNCFASLRPYRDFENLGIYFNNRIIAIIQNE